MWAPWSDSTNSAGSGTVPLLQSTADANISSATGHGIAATEHDLKPMQRSSDAHVHATEQDLPIQHNRHEADLSATTAEKDLLQCSTMLTNEIIHRPFSTTMLPRLVQLSTMLDQSLHVHDNATDTPTTYRLLLYWACARPVARVHMATVPQRRACKSLRATWTLQRMIQLDRYDLPACRGCREMHMHAEEHLVPVRCLDDLPAPGKR